MKKSSLLKTLRPAFTIIEILISVIIISISIIYVLKIHSQNHEHIIYISERNKLTLQDSLFLTDDIIKYHKDKKVAYDILEKHLKVKELNSRNLLKKNSREIFIPEQIKILPVEGYGPNATVDEIMLKDKHSSIYYRFKINDF